MPACRVKSSVNVDLLKNKIKQSGYKSAFLSETLGISRQAYQQKVLGRIPFRGSEIYVLCDLFKITDSTEKQAIFFANEVE